MNLSDEEIEILSQIEEGNSDLEQLYVFTNIDKEEIIKILETLKKKRLINLTKKFDSHYEEYYYNGTITEDGTDFLESLN